MPIMHRLFAWLHSQVDTEQYVDLTVLQEGNVEYDHALAIVEDRQREMYKKLCSQGKAMYKGYRPPEPLNGDRVGVHVRNNIRQKSGSRVAVIRTSESKANQSR